MNVKWYGWMPDLPDGRDFQYTPKFLWFLPRRADLRSQMPAVYNQGELGSCTANAIAGAMQFLDVVQQKAAEMPSRLFIYYNERALEGTVGQDAGAMIRDGIKTVAKDGVCPEDNWLYDITQFTVKPSDDCYTVAAKEVALKYSRVATRLRSMRSTLAGGFPFVFGATLYDSFESDAVSQSGMVPMPDPKEQPVGGHAMLCVGYDDSQSQFMVRNSWGDDWGDKGYCYFPYAYLSNSNMVDDLWVIEQES